MILTVGRGQQKIVVHLRKCRDSYFEEAGKVWDENKKKEIAQHEEQKAEVWKKFARAFFP
jgi:hypothetical protein